LRQKGKQALPMQVREKRNGRHLCIELRQEKNISKAVKSTADVSVQSAPSIGRALIPPILLSHPTTYPSFHPLISETPRSKKKTQPSSTEQDKTSQAKANAIHQ
jgi:hypothetical protein